MTDFIIHELRKEEIPLLDDFLYNAIFIPDWYKVDVPRDIIYNDAKVYAFIKDFGAYPDDYCLVAETNGNVIGAVWVRISNCYGHIDNKTPSFSISVFKAYRGQGIGTALMKSMLSHLKAKGYKRASLGVNKENYAVEMYEKLGFKIIGNGEDESEWLMIYEF